MKNPPQDDNIHKAFPAFSFAKKEEMSSQRQNDVFNEHAKYLVAKCEHLIAMKEIQKKLIRTARERRAATFISNSEKSLSGTLTSDPLTL